MKTQYTQQGSFFYFLNKNEVIRPILSQNAGTLSFATELPLLACFSMFPSHHIISVLQHHLELEPKQKQLNRFPTNELFSHLVSLPEVICAEDERVDDAEERDHVGDVVCGLQLVHDHAKAILLHLHTLETNKINEKKKIKSQSNCH